MKMVSIRKQKDGSAKMVVELTQREEDCLFLEGLRLMVGKKAKVLSMAEAKKLGIKGGKKYDATDEEVRQCIEAAVVQILRKELKMK